MLNTVVEVELAYHVIVPFPDAVNVVVTLDPQRVNSVGLVVLVGFDAGVQ